MDNIDQDTDLESAVFLNYILQTTQDNRSEELSECEVGQGNCDFNLTLCTHSSCNEINLAQLAQGFHHLDIAERIEVVRYILFNLSSIGVNLLMRSNTFAKGKRKG